MPAPKWTAIADELRRGIQDGVYPPGAQLPKSRQLMNTYGVSPGTVAKVIAQLTAEGLVTAKSSQGVIVRDDDALEWWPDEFEHAQRRADSPGAVYDAWAATVHAAGRTPRQEVEIGPCMPPSKVAELLQIGPSEPVVWRRQRTRYVDDQPVQTADTYYPMDVAKSGEGAPIMRSGDVTIPGGLIAAAGFTQVRFEDVLAARLPSVEEQKRLNLPETGIPVIEHIRTAYGATGRPVRCIVTVLSSIHNRLRWTVSAR